MVLVLGHAYSTAILFTNDSISDHESVSVSGSELTNVCSDLELSGAIDVIKDTAGTCMQIIQQPTLV